MPTYVIKATRRFYGPENEVALVATDGPNLDVAALYSRRADAESDKDALDSEVYRLAHNEYARPIYEVLPVSQLPKALRSAYGL